MAGEISIFILLTLKVVTFEICIFSVLFVGQEQGSYRSSKIVIQKGRLVCHLLLTYHPDKLSTYSPNTF